MSKRQGGLGKLWEDTRRETSRQVRGQGSRIMSCDYPSDGTEADLIVREAEGTRAES